MIIGTGVDIIEVDRVRGAIERHTERFLHRIYSKSEIDYCRESASPYQRFAPRFAAKEAVLKSLGIGWQKGAGFSNITVVNNAMGAPNVMLSGKSLEISEKLGVKKIHLSLSHTSSYAVAQAVAEG